MSVDKVLLNELRYAGKIKGNRPFIAIVRKGTTLHKITSIKYIISFTDELIYFNSFGFFSNDINNKDDFILNVKLFKKYFYKVNTKTMRTITLFTKDNKYLEISVGVNKKYTYSEINFNDFIEHLKQLGVKETNEATN